MRASFSWGLVAAALVGATGRVGAETVFTANLTHDQEVSNPPIPDEGSSGTGVFVLNDAQTQLTYDVQLVGLDLDANQTPGNVNDNVTRVHFHSAPAGSNGGIVFGIIDPGPTLQNDNNPNDLVVNPATGRITGVWNLNEGNATTLAAQLNSLFAHNLYFNVHTADHAGGEIRGQVVPEPSAFAAAVGAALLAGLRRTRRP